MIYIFDLDHTVIDSSHRQNFNSDGSLSLDQWRENCTAGKIMQDKLLPLASLMRSVYKSGHTVVINTARVISTHDKAYLGANGLRYHLLLSRDGDLDQRSDAHLKYAKLMEMCKHFEISIKRMATTSVFYDDNLKVLAMAKSLGILTKFAPEINAKMNRYGQVWPTTMAKNTVQLNLIQRKA